MKVIDKIKQALDETQEEHQFTEAEKLFLANIIAGVAYSDSIIRNLFYARAKMHAKEALAYIETMKFHKKTIQSKELEDMLLKNTKTKIDN